MNTKKAFLSMTVVGMAVCMFGAGCSRSNSLAMAKSDVDSIETIMDNHHVRRPQKFEGVALMRIVKGGVFGIGFQVAEATVYVKNAETGEFGPPAFVGYGGASIGLVFGFADIVDCAIFFKDRDDAIAFAERTIWANFTNEASFAVWGRKQMTICGGESFSDGAGLCLGAIEGELYLGGPSPSRNDTVYEKDDVSPEEILTGKVTVPDELKPSISKLNAVMGG